MLYFISVTTQKLFALILAHFCLLTPTTMSHANTWKDWCEALYRPLSKKDKETLENVNFLELHSLEALLDAFTHGLEIDPSDQSQRSAFDLYRGLRFGNPTTQLKEGTWDEITQALKKYPELSKEPFRNFKLQTQERTYPVTPELKKFIASQLQSTGQTRSNLFHIDANTGYWKKILQFDILQGDFSKILNFKLPEAVREKIIKAETPSFERGKLIFQFLQKEYKILKKQNKDVRPISQAIVDLIHTIGFHDPAIIQDLKSADGIVRLNAFRRAIDERDRFAMELGFENHFKEVLKTFHVTLPTGLDLSQALDEKLITMENDVIKNSQIQAHSQSRTIRHLSLTESPFRSCLGGSDCSSRTYLTRALDPNYHYFTITDENNYSTGQITVVLGDGRSKSGDLTKIAFIDKIQNVHHLDLPAMLEGIRQSVAEKGYILALPRDLGDHNGISNEELTRNFIKREIKTNTTQQLTQFKPHPHAYPFQDLYSRANQNLIIEPILPLSQDGANSTTHLAPDVIDKHWQVKTIHLDELVQKTYQLKNGNSDDHLKYIASIKMIKVAQLKVDPEYQATLTRWIQDQNEPFQIRKQALVHLWTERSVPFDQLLALVNPNDKLQILQSILGTPKYRDQILKDKSTTLRLIIALKNQKQLREDLITQHLGGQKKLLAPQLNLILDAETLSPEKKFEWIEQLKKGLTVPKEEEVLQLENQAEGTEFETPLKMTLPVSYALALNQETRLGSKISQFLNSSNPKLQDFGKRILNEAKNNSLSKFKILEAFENINTLKSSNPELEYFIQTATAWLKQKNVNPELKSHFLLSQFGSRDATGQSLYKIYAAALPQREANKIEEQLIAWTHLKIFEDLAHQYGLSEFLQNGKVESFEFRTFQFSKEGERVKLGIDEDPHEVQLTQPFQIQITPVTQLQWALLMEENPSRFKTNGSILKINQKNIPLNANRPVENVSWNFQLPTS